MDKDEPRYEVDSQLAVVKPRCHDEPRLRAGYTHDLDKYMQEHNRLFTMDHYSPYGPWPADFGDWTTFHNALYKSPKGTTTMDANVVFDIGKQIIIISPPTRWEFYPKVGERIVVSRSYPALDSITSGPATGIIRQSFSIE